MTEPRDTNINLVTNNVIFVLVSRLAMIATPFVAAALVYLASFWLTSQFTQQANSVQVLAVKVDNFQSQITAQAIVIADLKSRQDLTTLGSTDAASSLSSWEASTNGRLDKITDAITSLTASVAALNATLAAIQKGN